MRDDLAMNKIHIADHSAPDEKCQPGQHRFDSAYRLNDGDEWSGLILYCKRCGAVREVIEP